MRISLHKTYRRSVFQGSHPRFVRASNSEAMPFRRTGIQLLWDLAEATLGQDQPATQRQLEALRGIMSEFITVWF